MRHIVIPTDFTLQSLQVVHAAVAGGADKIRITLLHMLRPADISGMLFASFRNKQRSEQQKMVSEDFKETCEMLKNTYSSKLESIQVKFAMGDTAAYLRNYLDGEEIDCIVYAEDIKLTKPSKNSIDMMALIQRCKYNKLIVPSSDRVIRHQQEMGQLKGNDFRVMKGGMDYAITK